MPHGYSTRQAVNEQEVYSALCAATKGYGNAVKFARRMGLRREYIHGMLVGNRRVSAAVAEALGFELRWMRRRGTGQTETGTGTGDGDKNGHDLHKQRGHNHD